MLATLPNVLTLSRVLLVPVLVAAFFLPRPLANWLSLAIFVVASATDYLDGYLARKRNQASDFGAFLDPVADKLLVATALFMLAASGQMSIATVIAALLILAREFLVSGLREFLAARHRSMPVSQLAKWKTAVQMVAIGFLLAGDAANALLPAMLIGEIALWIAALLTIVTGVDYVKGSWPYLMGQGAAARHGDDATADDDAPAVADIDSAERRHPL